MKKLIKKALLVLALWIGCLSITPVVQGQCAMCKKTAEDANAQEDTKMASSINDGVLYLLAMPYLAAGVLGFIWYRKQRKIKPS